jgi:hypothetical protein
MRWGEKCIGINRSSTLGMFEREAIDADQIRAPVVEDGIRRRRKC